MGKLGVPQIMNLPNDLDCHRNHYFMWNFLLVSHKMRECLYNIVGKVAVMPVGYLESVATLLRNLPQDTHAV
jgi:hypothetical protein